MPIQPRIKLFGFKCSAFVDDNLVSMPGFSHRAIPAKERVSWYPFEEWVVMAWVYARNRTHAVRQLNKAGVSARDLDDGRKVDCPDCMTKLLTK